MICSDLKVIFIHIPRTGGTSVELGLTGKNWWHVEPATKHLTCTQAKELYSDIWDDYLKIAVVRNPWDWLVSLYLSHLAARSGGGQVAWEEFVLNPRLMPHEQDTVIQSEIIGDDVDLILRFEYLAQDFQTLCTMLNTRRTLPRFDAQSGRLGNKFQHYSSYYDERLRQIVAKRHSADIQRFNYEFASTGE